jgi:hypothetical protein
LGKKGFVSIATIIIIMVLLIGLMAIPVGINYISSLRKGISATQFAAEALTTCVKSYNESTNAAEFDSLVTIKKYSNVNYTGQYGSIRFRSHRYFFIGDTYDRCCYLYKRSPGRHQYII